MPAGAAGYQVLVGDLDGGAGTLGGSARRFRKGGALIWHSQVRRLAVVSSGAASPL